MRRNFTRTVSVLSAFAFVALVSCKDKEPQTTTSAATQASSQDGSARSALTTKIAAVSSTSSSLEQHTGLFSLVPANAGAFFFWDLSGPGYERMVNSRWGKSYLSRTQTFTTQMPEVAAMLKESGLNFDDPMELRKKVKEAIMMVTKPAGTEGAGTGALVLRTPDDATATQVTTSLKASVEKRGTPTTAVAGGFSFDMTLPVTPRPGLQQQPKTVKLMVKNVGEKIILANDPALFTSLTSGAPTGAVPAALTKLSMGAPSTDERVVLGYVDTNALISAEKDQQQMPISGAFLSIKMTDRPTIQLKLEKRPGAAKFEMTAPTKELLAAFPTDPILYTTFQAGSIRDMATNSSPDAANFMNDSQFAPLKSISQVALGAKAAPAGQAMLPIPELIIAVQTTQPKEFADEVMKSAQSTVKGYGLPGTTTEKTIAGHKVVILPGAMGLSLLLTQLDTAVIASTSETLMQDTLTRLAQSDPLAASTLSAPALQAMRGAGIGRVYLSFPEVAKLLESTKSLTGGLSGRGAPGAPPAANDPLSPENLKAMGDMGTLMGSMTDQGDELQGEITYL